jgi:hypothetical protein
MSYYIEAFVVRKHEVLSLTVRTPCLDENLWIFALKIE